MKTMTSNKILKSMAALVIMGAMMSGCAEEIEDVQPANQTVIQTTTISLAENASTRGVISSENGTTNFSAGDQIAVVYQNTNGETVKAVSEALTATDIINVGTAKFTVALTDPQPSSVVHYVYPAAMALDNLTDEVWINYAPLATQDGTLESLANNLALAVYEGTMSSAAILPGLATLENQLAIVKLKTIKDDADNDITANITNLTISDGSITYTVNRTAAAGPIYVAMRPTSGDITVKSIANNNKYIKTFTGKTLAQNTIYPINLSMPARYPLVATDANVSTEDFGCVLAANGNIYLNTVAAIADGTTAVAMIAYVGAAGSADTSHPTDNYRGLAIALTDAAYGCYFGADKTHWVSDNVSTMSEIKEALKGIANTTAMISDYGEGYAGYEAKNYSVPAPTGTSSWFLPSSGQWMKFFEAAGVDVAGWTSLNDWAPAPSDGAKADNMTKINTLLSAVGGNVLEGGYFTSAGYGNNLFWYVLFSSTDGVRLHNAEKTGPVLDVRSFLAF